MVLAAVGSLAGCGRDEGRTALAVRSTRWVSPTELAVTVECAELGTLDLEPGAGIDGLPLLTVWGDPQVGRCAPRIVVPIPAGVTRIDDAATGMVVDLPPRP
ncbi:hypothetical protein BH10ACT1_BH10ACT1_32500 [soil metagenome]